MITELGQWVVWVQTDPTIQGFRLVSLLVLFAAIGLAIGCAYLYDWLNPEPWSKRK